MRASADGIVVAYHPQVQEIGQHILRNGGNAADAFVASVAAENVLAEGASSLAGPLGVLTYFAQRQPAVEFLDADFDEPLDPAHARSRGLGRTVLVPGAPLGLCELSSRFGVLPLADVLQPAIELAEQGFAINRMMGACLAWRRKTLATTEYGRRTFFRDGRPLRIGDTLRQKEMGTFLTRLATDGPDYVYRGDWARQFLATVRAHGGSLTAADLERYRVAWHAPRTTTYRGHTIYAGAGPSYGSIWVLLALKCWEHAGAAASQRYWLDAETLEQIIRTARHVWSEPLLINPAAIANEDAVRIVCSDEHAAALWQRVRTGAAEHPLGAGGSHSYHIIVRDRDGNIVSGTTTILADPWARGLFVEGVPLTSAGAIPWNGSPGRRRLTPITMQFAFRDGQPRFVVGTISNSLVESAFQLLVNLIDGAGPTAADAIATPRFGTFPPRKWIRKDLPSVDRNWLDPRIPEDIVRNLKKRGLKVVQRGADTGLGAVLALHGDRQEGLTIPLPYITAPFEP